MDRLQLIVVTLAAALCQGTGLVTEVTEKDWCPNVDFYNNEADPTPSPFLSEYLKPCSSCQWRCPSFSEEGVMEPQYSRFTWELHSLVEHVSDGKLPYSFGISIKKGETDTSYNGTYQLMVCVTVQGSTYNLSDNFSIDTGYNFIWPYDQSQYLDIRVVELHTDSDYAELLHIPIPRFCRDLHLGQCNSCKEQDKDTLSIYKPSNVMVIPIKNTDNGVEVLVQWEAPVKYLELYPGQDLTKVLSYYLRLKKGTETVKLLRVMNTTNVTLTLNRSAMAYSVEIKTYECECSEPAIHEIPLNITFTPAPSTVSSKTTVSTSTKNTCTGSPSSTITMTAAASSNPGSSHPPSSKQSPTTTPPLPVTPSHHRSIVASLVTIGVLVVITAVFIAVFIAVAKLYFRKKRTVIESKFEPGVLQSHGMNTKANIYDIGTGQNMDSETKSSSLNATNVDTTSVSRSIYREILAVPDIDSRCKQVLLVHSIDTVGEEMNAIIALYQYLGSYEGIQVNHPDVCIKNMYTWVERKVKEADTVLCVCNKEFEQEWEEGNIANSPVACLKQLLPVIQEKIAVVLLYNTHNKYVTSLSLQPKRSFLFQGANVQALAHFVLEEPQYIVTVA